MAGNLSVTSHSPNQTSIQPSDARILYQLRFAKLIYTEVSNAPVIRQPWLMHQRDTWALLAAVTAALPLLVAGAHVLAIDNRSIDCLR